MKSSGNESLGWTMLCLAVLLGAVSSAATAGAGPREQAKRIHDRLTGIPPSADVLESMEDLVASGNAVGAALEAMENPAFYNTTVRKLAAPWTSRELSAFGDLNDATATVIGIIRDDVPFDQVLYEDIVYVGSPAVTDVPYARDDNDHYLDLQRNHVDLSDPANLVRRHQSALPDAASAAIETAGIMTTHGFTAAFPAGTGSAPLRFVTIHSICVDIADPWVDDRRYASAEPVGWSIPAPDTEFKTLGFELGQSRQFAECQVERVFRQLCWRDPISAADRQAVAHIADIFEASNRSMQHVYAHTAAYCAGD